MGYLSASALGLPVRGKHPKDGGCLTTRGPQGSHRDVSLDTRRTVLAGSCIDPRDCLGPRRVRSGPGATVSRRNGALNNGVPSNVQW